LHNGGVKELKAVEPRLTVKHIVLDLVHRSARFPNTLRKHRAAPVGIFVAP
jgi:hypothetical protein